MISMISSHCLWLRARDQLHAYTVTALCSDSTTLLEGRLPVTKQINTLLYVDQSREQALQAAGLNSITIWKTSQQEASKRLD
jgi:hypothetical protein